MKVKVKLFATFREGRAKEIFVELSENSTVRDAIKQVNIEPKEIAILLVNGRDGKLDQELTKEDYLSLFPPVGGG